MRGDTVYEGGHCQRGGTQSMRGDTVYEGGHSL